MISKLDKKDTNNHKNDIDIDIEIIDYLSEKGFVRRRDVVKHLIESHKDDRGYSKPSIDRKIARMIKLKNIMQIDFDKLETFGIKESDKRASYLALTRFSEIKDHLDIVIKLLSSDDVIDINKALKEIEIYQANCPLSSKQLDLLVENFRHENDELRNYLIKILHNQIIDKGKKPWNEDKFREVLRSLLEKYPNSPTKYKDLRKYIIVLLGYYNDDIVVDQLIKDAKTLEKLETTQYEFWDKFTATVIESHRIELFNLERKLEKEGKKKSADIISQIRYQALINLGMIKDSFSEMYHKGESK